MMMMMAMAGRAATAAGLYHHHRQSRLLLLRYAPLRESSSLSSSSSSLAAWKRRRLRWYPLPPTTTLQYPSSSLHQQQQQQQQVRFLGGRHDRHTVKERKPTKKQRKAYHRKLQAERLKKERHGKPGSKAGPRREFVQQIKQEYLFDNDNDEEEEDPLQLDEYTVDDALLEDLMGNTRQLSSQPTPEPQYLGHMHDVYLDRVSQQMKAYRQEQQQLLSSGEHDEHDDASLVFPSSQSSLPPADRDIALLLRAFRDAHGTRQKPVGLVPALQHLMQHADLQLSLDLFGEYTYTALMTCCRTPSEARRCLRLHIENGHAAPSAYSWSILVDVYSKVGDFQGAAAALQEMLEQQLPLPRHATNGSDDDTTATTAPLLAAYTSLLAACFKVCNDGGRVPHAIRAQAGEMAWTKWKEMRVAGIDPDVMAYGAMLRICAARGHAERAINLLEEMPQMQVKPTTLCFTAALRAIARSQAISVRYEKGSSRRHGRREFLTQHHGKMARSVLILAENAEVEHDDGLVAALILCAANAGDVATAKAIYVASQVRNLDHLRTIGSDAHLAQLRGEEQQQEEAVLLEQQQQQQLLNGSGGGGGDHMSNGLAAEESLVMSSSSMSPPVGVPDDYHPPLELQSFGEREYGKDTRTLSAILHACAVAADQTGMGTMWQGRENRGFLCENSLRLLATPRKPRYVDNRIPGQGRTDNLTWEGEDRELDFRGDKRQQRKFQGIEFDDSGGTTLDDLDDMFYKMYMDKDGRLKEEYRATTPEDIWRLKYGNDDDVALAALAAGTGDTGSTKQQQQKQGHVAFSDKESSQHMFFDKDKGRWSYGSSARDEVQHGEQHSGPNSTGSFVGQSSSPTRTTTTEPSSDRPSEMYFDLESRRWKEGRPKNNIAPADIIEEPLAAEQELEMEDTVIAEEKDDEDNAATELYFDVEERRWKTRSTEEANAAKRTSFEDEVLLAADDDSSSKNDLFHISANDEEAFALFFSDLQDEVAESGEDPVTEEEARELFVLMKEEFGEAMSMDAEDLGLQQMSPFSEEQIEDNPEDHSSVAMERLQVKEDNQEVVSNPEASFSSGTQSSIGTVAETTTSVPVTQQAATSRESVTKTVEIDESFWSRVSDEVSNELGLDMMRENQLENSFTDVVEHVGDDEMIESDFHMEELRRVLPTFSEKRLRRVKRAFQTSLSDPSLLELVPLVRERMPDYITATWLKQMSSMTARYVMYKAAKEDLIDLHMLNGVLELDTASGSLDRAVKFFETEFEKHGLEPNGYSNRLMVQMFLKNNRLSRALAFKHKIEQKGKSLDIAAYGSLVDYCARRGQLGSALSLLKECLSVHEAPPGEAYVSQLRILCRQQDVTEEVDLVGMVGEDPTLWLRHGEAHLKREMSKRGRREVQHARNKLLQI